MDNPNIKPPRCRKGAAAGRVNIRHHKSLPGPLRPLRPASRSSHRQSLLQTTSHLIDSKTNPYVGWFRHAPPLAEANKRVLWFDPSTVFSKRRRSNLVTKGNNLIGTFSKLNVDERTKTLAYLQKILTLQQKLQQAERDMDKVKRHKYRSALLQHRLLLSTGYLPGGGKEEGEPQDDVEKFLLDQCSESESATVKVLSRLACWFLDVPLIDEHSFSPPPAKVGLETAANDCADSASLISDDQSEYDHFDTAADDDQVSDMIDEETMSISASLESSTVLSSQAEAYYALNAVHSQLLENGEPSNNRRSRSNSVPDSASRLDYDISQMDILRMNRIASRHLDVESIVRLPTVTYGPENDEKAMIATTNRNKQDIASTKNRRNAEATETDEAPPTDESWMLVPPQEEIPDEMRDPESVQRIDSMGKDVKGDDDKMSEEQRDVCVICLEHFQPGDRLRILPCKHSFHVGCIDRWLSGSHSFDNCYTSGCPTCKKRPDHPNGYYHQSQQRQFLQLHQSDGSVPSWAFAQIGDAMARESQHF